MGVVHRLVRFVEGRWCLEVRSSSRAVVFDTLPQLIAYYSKQNPEQPDADILLRPLRRAPPAPATSSRPTAADSSLAAALPPRTPSAQIPIPVPPRAAAPVPARPKMDGAGGGATTLDQPRIPATQLRAPAASDGPASAAPSVRVPSQPAPPPPSPARSRAGSDASGGSETTTEATRTWCRGCKTILPAGSKFCTGCGQPVAVAQQQRLGVCCACCAVRAVLCCAVRAVLCVLCVLCVPCVLGWTGSYRRSVPHRTTERGEGGVISFQSRI